MNIRLVRPFGPLEIRVGDDCFSTSLGADEADALLCEWAPTEELLHFPGPSAWYTAEPRANPRIGVLAHPDQRAYLDRLRPEQLLHHAHEDRRFRVPHMTHDQPTLATYDGPREHRAVTVVSNFGGPLHNRGPEVRLRNAFATAPGVDLFGRRDKWKHYRGAWWSWPRAPDSYRGEVTDVTPDKVDLLARYDVAICLENSCEPLYFSEKFVDGVRAGCVPVYRAHASVRDGVLSGAAWIDPADHGFDVGRTLEAALASDRAEIDETNRRWLGGEAVRATSLQGVWGRIAEALREQPGRRAGP